MIAIDLMSHQIDGVEFLLNRRAGILAFEQGLGKTLVAIAAFSRLRGSGAADTLIVICPNSLKRTWVAEVARFAPDLTWKIIEGNVRVRRQLLASTREDIVILSYETARSEIVGIRALMGRRKVALVLDESHFVKNLRSLSRVAMGYFAPLTEYRWLLSGTPLTNTVSDLYSQVGLVTTGNPLGSYEAFVLHFGDVAKNPRTREEFVDVVAPYLLRRTKEQCLNLPDKTFVDLCVELPAWQRRLYDEMRDGIIREVREMSQETYSRFLPSALTRLLRLAQIASNPALVYPEETKDPAKLVALDDLLEELIVGTGRKVVIWSYYVSTIERLVQRYASFGAVSLYGGTPPESRQAVARKFQEDPDTFVLIANPAAAGTGFTLTAASHTVYESFSWRYDLYAQSQDRVHRIGQTMPVTYTHVVAQDTIDEVILQVLRQKSDLARSAVGDRVAPSSIAQLTPEEFCRMLETNRMGAGT